jgi:hypothetical protein
VSSTHHDQVTTACRDDAPPRPGGNCAQRVCQTRRKNGKRMPHLCHDLTTARRVGQHSRREGGWRDNMHVRTKPQLGEITPQAQEVPHTCPFPQCPKTAAGTRADIRPHRHSRLPLTLDGCTHWQTRRCNRRGKGGSGLTGGHKNSAAQREPVHGARDKWAAHVPPPASGGLLAGSVWRLLKKSDLCPLTHTHTHHRRVF